MVTRGPALLLVAGAAVMFAVRQPWWALAVIAAVVVLSGIDLALAAAVRDVQLRREGDRQIRLGESGTVRLLLTNTGFRPLRGRVRDAWVPSAGATPAVQAVGVGAGEAVAVTTTLTPTRRGDRAAVQVSIRSYGPLGLAYRQARARHADQISPPWTVRVLPRFESRRILPEKVARLRIFDGAVVTRGRGQGTEFDALREYVVGDDVRSIDWRATARRQDVVVRTWRPERDRRVLAVIDCGRTSAVRLGDPRDGGGQPRLDSAIDATLLLGELAHRAGDRFDLLAVDTQVRAAVTGGPGRTLLARLGAALATVESSLVETNFRLVVAEVLRRERKRALVVLFTALEPGALGEGLLPVLTALTARHKVLLASIVDPVLTRLLADRSSIPAIYAAAAAHRTAVERERVRTALARRGVEVVDAPAELFASRVADAYLAMKAAGRL